MMAFMTTYILPVLQSIIASRMYSALDDWVRKENTSDEGRFCQMMKQAFVAAVKKVKGDSPKTIKDNVDELFDICSADIVKELQTMEPAQVMAYVGETLYNAFKTELENNIEAIPYINKTLLENIQKQSKDFESKLQDLSEKTSDIQNSTKVILGITQKLMGEKGLSACKIFHIQTKLPFYSQLFALSVAL